MVRKPEDVAGSLAPRILANRSMTAILRRRSERHADLEALQRDWQAAIAAWQHMPPPADPDSIVPESVWEEAFAPAAAVPRGTVGALASSAPTPSSGRDGNKKPQPPPSSAASTESSSARQGNAPAAGAALFKGPEPAASASLVGSARERAAATAVTPRGAPSPHNAEDAHGMQGSTSHGMQESTSRSASSAPSNPSRLSGSTSVVSLPTSRKRPESPPPPPVASTSPAEAITQQSPPAASSNTPTPAGTSSSFLPFDAIDPDDHLHKVPSLLYLSYREGLALCLGGQWGKATPILSHIIDAVGATSHLGAIVFANRAVCNFALRNYFLCVKDCTEAMARAPLVMGSHSGKLGSGLSAALLTQQQQAHLKATHVAALVRRAHCHVCLSNFAMARTDILAAERHGHPLAAPLSAAVDSLERYETLKRKDGGRWQLDALEAMEAVCRVVANPTFEAARVACLVQAATTAPDRLPAILAVCADLVLVYPDNAPDLWYWFGRLQFLCAADTAALSDVQRVLHRAVGMGGMDGHAAAKQLLAHVRSCESRSAVAAAFTGTRRFDQALQEYGRLLTSGQVLPPLLKAHFLVRRAWVAALACPGLPVLTLWDGLEGLAQAEALVTSFGGGSSSNSNGGGPSNGCSSSGGPSKAPSGSASPAALEEILRCRVALLLAVNDSHAALAAAKAALAQFPHSAEIKKVFMQAVTRCATGAAAASQAAPSSSQSQQNAAAADRRSSSSQGFRPAASPRAHASGAWAQNARPKSQQSGGGFFHRPFSSQQAESSEDGIRSDGDDASSATSSSEDDAFSSLNPNSFRKGQRSSSTFGFRPESARGGSGGGGTARSSFSSTNGGSGGGRPGGAGPQRPSSARPAFNRAPPPPEHYLLLGIAPSTPTAGVIKAYRELALRWHPDRWSGSSAALQQQAEGTFKRIQHAYSILGDAAQRMAYDKSLGL